MADVVFVAILIGFFALAIALVHACDHVIGAETTLTTVEETDAAEASTERAAA